MNIGELSGFMCMIGSLGFALRVHIKHSADKWSRDHTMVIGLMAAGIILWVST